MIQSVQKAMRILNILAENRQEPISLGELSRKSEIHKATCSHIVSTLEAEGYVVKISSRKGYILGPAAYCLSRFGRYKSDFVTLCRPVLEYLHKVTGRTVILAVLEGNSKYIIDHIDENHILENHTEILEDDIYRTATGRVILANLPEAKIYDIYKKYGNPKAEEWADVSSLKELVALLPQKKEMVKSRTATSDFVNLGYGVALFSATECVGAVGIAVKIPKCEETAFSDEEIRIKQILTTGASEISRRLSVS